METLSHSPQPTPGDVRPPEPSSPEKLPGIGPWSGWKYLPIGFNGFKTETVGIEMNLRNFVIQPSNTFFFCLPVRFLYASPSASILTSGCWCEFLHLSRPYISWWSQPLHVPRPNRLATPAGWPRVAPRTLGSLSHPAPSMSLNKDCQPPNLTRGWLMIVVLFLRGWRWLPHAKDWPLGIRRWDSNNHFWCYQMKPPMAICQNPKSRNATQQGPWRGLSQTISRLKPTTIEEPKPDIATTTNKQTTAVLFKQHAIAAFAGWINKSAPAPLLTQGMCFLLILPTRFTHIYIYTYIYIYIYIARQSANTQIQIGKQANEERMNEWMKERKKERRKNNSTNHRFLQWSFESSGQCLTSALRLPAFHWGPLLAVLLLLTLWCATLVDYIAVHILPVFAVVPHQYQIGIINQAHKAPPLSHCSAPW